MRYRSALIAGVLPMAWFACNGAMAQTALGVQTGTSVVVTQPAGGGPSSTATTTTYASGPAAVTAQATADTAQANLLTAQAQARTAQIAAVNAALPASTTSGTVTLQAGAGTEEANVLAAVALNGAAQRIVSKLGDDKTGAFLIVTGNSLPDFSGWLTFDAKVTYLSEQLTTATKDYGKALNEPPLNVQFQDLTGAGEALSSLVKLAQLAATDWTAGGLALTTDDYMLAVAVSDRAPNAIIYNQSTSIKAYEAVKTRLDDVDHLRQTAATDSLLAAKTSAALKAKAKTDTGAAADADTKKAADMDNAVSELNAAVTNYDNYLAQLSGSPAPSSSTAATSSVTMSAILQQWAGYQASTQAGALLLRVHSASGGLYTQKNLWSALGAMPFYASGGVVVSYSFTKPAAHSAALFEVVVPYAKVGEVRTIADLDFLQLCDTAPTTGPHAANVKKYCPILPVK